MRISIIEISGCTYSVGDFDQSLEIVIPDTVDTDWIFWAISYKKKYRLQEAVLDCQLRKTGVLVDCDVLNTERQLRLVDIPQTLSL